MSYRIVVDSCGEFTRQMEEDPHFVRASLHIYVDEYEFIDDESFDRLDFLKKMKASPNCPKSSCPSPEVFREAYDCGADHVYAVTLSGALSGSYNSAVLGANMYLEDHPDAKIHVFNSKSASIGETRIAQMIQHYEEEGLPFEEVVEKAEAFLKDMRTYFVLESLDNLRKNGRLSAVKALVASALNIKPYMGENGEGEIIQLGQARGMQKSLKKMLDTMAERVEHPEEKVLALSHCNNPERAQFVKEEILKRIQPKEILILESSGITSLYADDGGIVLVI